MRVTLLGSFMALAVTIAGAMALRIAGLTPQRSAMLTALAAAVVASVAAGLPIMLVDRRSQAAMMQASLLATVLHMVVMLGAAGVVLLGHFPAGSTFVYWLAAMYVTTLLAVVLGIVRSVSEAASSQKP